MPFDDWVFGLASRGNHLLAGVTSRLHVLDTTTLKPLKTLYHQVGHYIHPLEKGFVLLGLVNTSTLLKLLAIRLIYKRCL